MIKTFLALVQIAWTSRQLAVSVGVVLLACLPLSAKAQAPAGLYYIHVDHLGTPRQIYDQNQQLAWRWDQAEPFGNSPPNENPSGLGTFEFAPRFPGQQADKETNLAYNYFRDFDPGLGRYVESDLIGLRGGLNTYAYVGSSPLQNYDPDGLDRWGADPTFNWSMKAGVPIPQTPELYIFTMCLRNCIGEHFVVTSTSEAIPQHPVGSPHRQGTALDIRYPPNSDDYLCCAKRCGARFGLDEKRNPSAKSTAAHFHLQLTGGRRGGSGDLPSDKKCDPCNPVDKWKPLDK